MVIKTIKGASIPRQELNAYSVGLLRLSEANISADNFDRDQIEYIGKCSLQKHAVVLGLLNQKWVIKDDTNADFIHTQFIIKGKRVMRVDNSRPRYIKPISKVSANEIFRTFMGTRFRKHGPKATLTTRLEYAEIMQNKCGKNSKKRQKA